MFRSLTPHFFHHDGFRLAYYEEGAGEPILLIHGFASSTCINWAYPGWFRVLTQAGYRVIGLDNRGHGDSDKSYDKRVYTPEAMASDAIALLDFLDIPKAHIMGYSMGARICAYMALHDPAKIATIILGGLGIGLVTGAGSWEPIAEALLAEDVASISNPRGLMFRSFSDRNKSDRKALAACVITSKKELTEAQVQKIQQPVLVAVGTKDDIAGSPDDLVQLLPHGTALAIPNRDHMLAVGDKVYKEAVLGFLKRHPLKESKSGEVTR